MNMDTVSDALRELLDRQGMTRDGLAGPMARRNKSPARSTMARSGEVTVDSRGGGDCPPIGNGGGPVPMRIQEKDRSGEAPAKFGMLRLISNTDGRAHPKASNARLGARQPLVLVWSDGHLVTRRL